MISEKNGIRKQIGSTPRKKLDYRTTFLSPLIIFKKKDFNKNVLDAGHLNTNTNQSSESWPLEPLATQLARAENKTNLHFILCLHKHLLHLMMKLLKLLYFHLVIILLLPVQDIMALRVFQFFFSHNECLFFKDLLPQGSVLVYNDDISLMSKSKPRGLQLHKTISWYCY